MADPGSTSAQVRSEQQVPLIFATVGSAIADLQKRSAAVNVLLSGTTLLTSQIIMSLASTLDRTDIDRALPRLTERFELLGNAPIGEPSGFGAVWRAFDRLLQQEVAIKISDQDCSGQVISDTTIGSFSAIVRS